MPELPRAGEGRLASRPGGPPPGGPAPAGLHRLELPGVEAFLAVPAGEPGPRPLLVFFHGAGGTALANGDLAGAVLAFSPGFVASPTRVGRPRVRVSHGTADRVLPVDRCGRRVVQQLTAAGYDVTYDEFDGGHVIPPSLVDAALDWWLPGERLPG